MLIKRTLAKVSQLRAVPSQHVRSIFKLFVAPTCTIRKDSLERFRRAGKAEMSKTNWSKQTQTGNVGVDLGTVSRFKTTVVAVITGCSLACCGSGWVRGWVLGTWVGKSLLWFLVDIHLSWLCQPPTFSILEQWQRKHWDLCLSGMRYCSGPDKTFHVPMVFEYTVPHRKS